MASIAERQMACLQIEKTYKHGDKHAILIVLTREGIVDAGADLCWHHALIGQRLEQSGGLCHKQRSGNSLATHIAYTEIEFVIVHDITIQVATNLTGRSHRGVHIESFYLWECAGHHRHLNVAGDTQLTLDTLFDGGSLLQLVIGLLQFFVCNLEMLCCPVAEQHEDDHRN